MLWGIEIESGDIGCFGFKLRVVAGHAALQTGRHQTGLFPDALDSVFADTQSGRELAATPVGRTSFGLFRVAEGILARRRGVHTEAVRPG